MNRENKRLLGIDLCRGIAAYAVVVVHSGDENWGVPLDLHAVFFRFSFYFAVPFFLLTSFYFMVRKPISGMSVNFWKSRLQRLLIPYLIWSLTYLALRLVFFWKSEQANRLDLLIQDPLSIVFFGGASFHLYFLPLLFIGSLLFIFNNYFLSKKLNLGMLAIFCVSIVIVCELPIFDGNKIQSSVDLNPLIRLTLVYLAWLLRCLIYFLTAIILNEILSNKGNSWLLSKASTISLPIIFFVATIYGRLFLPITIRDIIMACSMLLFGISISRYINENNKIISSLGVCSFGIYCIHIITMNFLKLFLSKFGIMDRVTIGSMLIISMTTFLLSWLIVSLMLKRKWATQYLFGIL
jgi:peptidoglycan/LPS O-acetylase OafA/YrhL